MATCDAQDALTAAKCFACLSPVQVEWVKLSLLCQILQQTSPMATCSPQELLEAAKCFACLNPVQVSLVQTQLLCEILNGGSTPGETCITCGLEAPTDPAPCDCSIYYTLPPNAGVWVWDALTDTWEMILNPGV